MCNIPRPEYPRPQLVREDWINLNGTWEFEIDQSNSGKERKLYLVDHLSQKILVPFCPESKLSGIGFTDFMNCVWYRKEVTLPSDWERAAKAGEHILLHFGAVDYKAAVYLNGTQVCVHEGGFSPFSVDAAPYIKDGKLTISLCAEDDVRSMKQPAGKQSAAYASEGCYYTRTTGIWQTVWMERVSHKHIMYYNVYPDAENGSALIRVFTKGSGALTVKASYDGKTMAEKTVMTSEGCTDICLALAEKHLWEVGQGRLYDLTFDFGEDHVSGYFGLRSVRMDGFKFLLNGKSVFQRLVLDQGYYPDGIYTARDDSAFVQDIEISLAAGFNGARLHEKVFEPRFLYYCDKMGYLVWGEFPNWNFDISYMDSFATFWPQWAEVLQRDFNHPSIIGWCPFNETWDTENRQQCDQVLELAYRMTKLADPTRPCIDTSGNFHVATDIFDLHDYDQNPETFKARYDPLMTGGEVDIHFNCGKDARGNPRHVYKGEPVFVSEYGGIKWDADGGIECWGYGNAPKTEEEFIERYRGLTKALMENDKMFGFCYTQLYDVEQEKNGLYTYGRVPKFDMDIFKNINSAKAAIED